MVTEHDTARPSLRRRGPPSWRALIAAVLALVGVAFLIDAHFIEPARLVVKREELHLPRLPPQLVGLRVALLSDLHVGSPH
jgi:predicted MPP superfamily phosphohydrolase